MSTNNIIVIGASAGGFEALKVLVAGLPPDLPAAILIVWHMSPDIRGVLPEVLNRIKTLPASQAYDREPIEPGRIYVAAPDRHLVIEDGQMRTTRGPKENRFRPAVDPLFRSAAYYYGPDVIGIILSGGLDDGTSGLWTIKQRGGVAIVQDPKDAEVASMPANAIRAVDVDHIVPVAEMAGLLVRLLAEKEARQQETRADGLDDRKLKLLKTEIGIAMQENALETGIMEFGELSPYTCPECHGVLSSIRDGNLRRFRCHTGHAFSPDSLLMTATEHIEESLWSAIRGIEECIILLNNFGDHFAEINQPNVAANYFNKANEASRRSELIRRAVFSHELLTEGSIRLEAADIYGRVSPPETNDGTAPG